MNGFFDILSLQGVTLASANISSDASAGFEIKSNKHAAYVSITRSEIPISVYLSLFIGNGHKSITSEEVKKLPHVAEGETITALCEIYASSLEGSRVARLEMDFYDEDGGSVGTTEYIAADESEEWQPKKKEVTVPSGATRCNFYLRGGCDNGETITVWLANLRIHR